MKIYFLLSLLILFTAHGAICDEQQPIPVELNVDSDVKNLVIGDENEKIEIDDFFQHIKPFLPGDFTVDSATVYAIDLSSGAGKNILAMIRNGDNSTELLVMDRSGKLLASESSVIGNGLFFGPKLKGFPVVFGYQTDSYLSAGVCDWTFDIFENNSIKKVAGAFNWIGNSGPGTNPYFKWVPSRNVLELISDEGLFCWDESKEKFENKGRAVGEEESPGNCPSVSGKQNHLESGKSYFLQKEYDCAIFEYRLSIEENPGDYAAWQYLGYACLAKGDSQDAVNCLKRSVRIKPDYVMGHYNLALAYFLNLENDKAVSQIAEVIKLDPSKKNTIQKDGQFKFILRSQEFLEWEKMSGAWEDPAAKE
jgi:hypothetical protein